ncbi:Aste57867_8195 [Aphanomyces stellatus]|uniref:Aste57867_8195 protein n=1 Tax=Aphanomyces stellatus TaxID=120398 RepID=A0A485KJL4_9STRA|nr:hypothetical protein As57867_008164 [Aphanomyces stellatus]VFT85083.1 Aste57867_8195 [Aphanomyces stellatus]
MTTGGDPSKFKHPYTYVSLENTTALHIDCDRTFVVEDVDATTMWFQGVPTTAAWDSLSYYSIDDGRDIGLKLKCRATGPHLVNIYVPTRSIRTISFTSDGTLVVYPNTLMSSPTESISITNANTGMLFVQDRTSSIQNLHLYAAGAGSIQWDVPTTVVAAAADLRTSDAGNVTLLASNLFLAHELTVSTASSGSVAISAANLTAETTLTTDVSGLGDVVLSSRTGACSNHILRQMGPGNAYTSDVTCAQTSVTAASTGDTYVAASATLVVNQMGSGTVYLVGRTLPRSIQGGAVHRLDTDPSKPSILQAALPPHALAPPLSRDPRTQSPPADWDTERGGIRASGDFYGDIQAVDLDCGRTFLIEAPDATHGAYEVVTDARYFQWRAFGMTVDADGVTLVVVCEPLNVVEPFYLNLHVPTRSIRKITARAAGDVVVYPKTLAANNATNVTIQTAGAGNVFVQDNTVVAHSVHLQADKAGSIQWNVPTTVVTDTLRVQAADAGSVFVFASTSLAATSLTATTFARGSIAIDATSLSVVSLHTDISGAGGVVYSTTAGTCANHSIKQMGPGNAYTSAIPCANTTILAASTGDIFVSTTASLEINQMGSGTVYLQQRLPPPPQVSGPYQLLQTHPAPIGIPVVPVPPHVLKSHQPPPSPETPSPWVNVGVACVFVLVGLVYCFWRCWCCRQSLSTTKPSQRTRNETSTLYGTTRPTTHGRPNAPTAVQQYQNLLQHRQQQLYNPNSGTINYVNQADGSVQLIPDVGMSTS